MATLTYFEDGFEYGVSGAIPDYDFVLYSRIQGIWLSGTDVKMYVRGREDDDNTGCSIEIPHETTESARLDVETIRKHMHKWLNRSAVQRKEERARLAAEAEFRASLLAHLGKLTERIAFDPDVGDEALDAIERCKNEQERGESKNHGH